MDYSENNKRIAKNTLILYIRMLFAMGVGLFTSRVILSTLGIEDYGIYNIVGGVVALFSFLNNTLSTATSRFITFELGTGDSEKLKKVFGAALTVHIILVLIVLVLAETIGLWFLEYKLVIPENRMTASRIVYQLSIIVTMIGIIRVPYNASIIAHERMNVYAYFSIIEVLLRLVIVYMVTISNFDKLVVYAVLVLVVGVFMTFLYGYYVSKHFIEGKFRFCHEKNIIAPILSFSGWDLYGNMSVIARTQGVNVLQNIFFGPLINAAGGIASQVQNTVAGFAENFLTSVRPQIVKNYAQGKINEMQNLVINSSKFSFLLLFFVSFPLIMENKYVLNLWLLKVPDYSVIFCRLVLITNLISIIFRPLTYSVHATGRIKKLSFINGTVLFLTLPISYYFLKIGYTPIIPYIINIILLIVCCLYGPFLLKLYIPSFSIYQFFIKSLFIVFVIIIISTPIPIFFHLNFEEGLLRLILVGISSILCIGISAFFIAIKKDDRKLILLKTKELIKMKGLKR